MHHTDGIKRKSWVDSKSLSIIKAKRSAWNKYNKNRTPENWDHYIVKRNIATATVKNAKRLHESNIAKQIKTNPMFLEYGKTKNTSQRKITRPNNRGEYKY